MQKLRAPLRLLDRLEAPPQIKELTPAFDLEFDPNRSRGDELKRERDQVTHPLHTANWFYTLCHTGAAFAATVQARKERSCTRITKRRTIPRTEEG